MFRTPYLRVCWWLWWWRRFLVVWATILLVTATGIDFELGVLMVFGVVLCGGSSDGVCEVAVSGGVYVVAILGVGVCDDFIGGLKVVVNVEVVLVMMVAVVLEAALKW
ncbi:Hypothetical predicted protein [Olea europaea subsp. europaea]|uniref:Transmembrane protein n=1 Tax=Olea europaea subsp. europaea TaxID=158383 RepID=A0A8S0Q8X8_OLEEU|nr:Hypothetical predicted protein [Olea europaea subsp. europaea]